MDLSDKIIDDIVHPTAILSLQGIDTAAIPGNNSSSPRPVRTSPSASLIHDQESEDAANYGDEEGPPTNSWEWSQLNPKNRIESLEPPKDPMWRIDGCTGLGTQFYAIPLHMAPTPPLRIDVFINEQAEQHPLAREILGLASAFHMKDADRVRKLGISNYIIRALNIWAQSFADFPVFYKSLPFGSCIIFTNLPLDLRDLRIEVAQEHNLERDMLSVSALLDLWNTKADKAQGVLVTDIIQDFPIISQDCLPERVNIFDLDILQQVHDSTCIVGFRGEKFIFKSVTSYTKYIYHELRNLLSMKPHANVISRPKHLITKKSCFGGKTGIVGFTLEFHPQGTMRDIISSRRLNNRLTPKDQMLWAKQVTSALIHFHNTKGPFYPDMRLDNLVLSNSGDAIMVDFEQRGVWCEFGPPEVNALDYVRLLATDRRPQNPHVKHVNTRPQPNPSCDKNCISGAYDKFLTRMLPGYTKLIDREDYTKAGVDAGGYNIAWLCLSPREREAAEVYMLGRILYCIFEGVSAPNRTAIWQSYRVESDVEFPEWKRAPKRISQLVDKCTRGRRPNLSTRLERVGDKLVVANRDDHDTRADSADEVYHVSQEFWRGEISYAKKFLENRLDEKERGSWNENVFHRPSAEEVLSELEEISVGMGL